MQELVIY